MSRNNVCTLGLLLVLTLMFIPLNVKAICDYEQQNQYNKEASNIKADYTVNTRQVTIPVSGGEDTFDTQYFVFNVYNLTDNLRISVTENEGSVREFSSANMQDGKISMEVADSYSVSNFNIKVYTTGNTPCANELVREMNLVVPRINPYASYQICEEAKGYYLCSEYTSVEEDVSETEFFEGADEFLAEEAKNKENDDDQENSSIFNKILDFLVNYWYYIASGAIVVGIVVTIIIVLIKRRRII